MITLDVTIALLRVLMLAARRWGCGAWADPVEHAGAGSEWAAVARWIALARAHTTRLLPAPIAVRTVADLDAWTALYGARDGSLAGLLPEHLRRLLIPAALSMGWRPVAPDPDATPEGLFGDERWALVSTWVAERYLAEEPEPAAIRAAWLLLFEHARPT
jgi:hypothetical protein